MATVLRTSTTYLVYIDDSGDSHHDVLAAVCVPVDSWAGVLGFWKGFRRQVERQWKIPTRVEFHSNQIVSRSKAPLPDPAHPGEGVKFLERAAMKDGKTVDRIDLFRLALHRVADMNTGQRDFGVHILCVRKGVANGQGHLHASILRWLQDLLTKAESWGIVWVDGTAPNKETELRGVHRALDLRSRRVLEDASGRSSLHSHFLQMADVCAYAAFKDQQYTEGSETRRRLGTAFDILSSCAQVRNE